MIINDLDGYYIVFDTKNWNTELDTLFNKFGCKGNVCTYIPCKVGAYGLLLKSPPYRSYLSREPCWKSTDTFRGNKILINPENADAKIGK